jgi:sortase A
MQDARPSSGNDVSLFLLTWAERLLVAAGLAALAWSAAAIAERHFAQHFAHETLVTMSAVPAPLAPAAAASPARRAVPSTGAALADLTIPRVSLSAVVLQGSDAGTLRRGVGHIEHTAFPGESGNVALAGHRDSFFRPLQRVRVGDEVLLETPQGRMRYRVAWLRVVPPTEVSVLGPTAEPALTLVTCYPFWVFGQAPDRFIVRATRVSDVASGAPQTETRVVSHRDDGPAIARATARPADDETLVRQAIERFRLTYNARFTTRFEQAGRLEFQRCQVHVAGAEATAVCEAAAPLSSDVDERERAFTLRKAGGVWTIRSFAMWP